VSVHGVQNEQAIYQQVFSPAAKMEDPNGALDPQKCPGGDQMRLQSSCVAASVLCLLLIAPAAYAGQSGAGSGAGETTGESSGLHMSDREQRGLKGPVETCVQENTYPASTLADGTQIPERKYHERTEYSSDGRMMSTTQSNGDHSEWETQFTYDANGQLLKTKSGNKDEKPTETIYSYDEKGKLLTIRSSNSPGDPITFHYDEQGRKTKVQVSRPEDYRPNVAQGGSPFEVADRPPNLPGGGTATTIYDEQDRPVEVQVRDQKGELISRALRTYNMGGRVTEEKQVLASPEMMIPADARAQLLQESGASIEELREQLTDLMGGQAGPYSIAYSYDSHGRQTMLRRRIFNREEEIETTYNEQGDKASEITRTISVGGSGDEPPGPPEYSEARYTYQYDDYGNWTEQAVSFRSSPDGTFQSSFETRRTLTYY
jgi:antitoxin component YwqK of YwqJK toxin-antitoxin module